MHRIVIAGTMILSLSVSGNADAAACRSDGPDVRAIKSAIDRYVSAVDRDDADTLVNTYSKDIEFMVEGGPTHHGLDHARDNFAAMFAQTKTHYIVKEDEVTVCGPIAYDTGSVVFQVTPKSGGPMHQAKLRFLEIWRKGPNGWQISRLMNNKDS
jgi:ketosteroid isomerase-like protein